MVTSANSRPHTLYRMYDENDTLLYVGISADLEKRLIAHRADKEWWESVAFMDVAHYPTRAEAAAAEAIAIATENPVCNVAGKTKGATLFDADLESALESLLGDSRTGDMETDLLAGYKVYVERQQQILDDISTITDALLTNYGMSYRDIEKVTGVPRSTLLRWRHLARKRRAAGAA